MKKILCATIALTLSTGLCSCAFYEKDVKPPKTAAVTTTYEKADDPQEPLATENSAEGSAAALSSAVTNAAESLQETSERAKNAVTDPPQSAEVTQAETKEDEEKKNGENTKTEEDSEFDKEFDEFLNSITEDDIEDLIALFEEWSNIDKTIYPDLQYVLDKYGIDISTLISLSGMSEEDFFYNWNNCGNEQLKSYAENYLFGENCYVNPDTTHLTTPEQVTIKPIAAQWDADGRLHVLCSVKTGLKGFTYNVYVDNFNVYSNGSPVASKSFGLITEYVDDILSGESYQGIFYDNEMSYDFIFEGDSVLEPYANIMNNLEITYCVSSQSYWQY